MRAALVIAGRILRQRIRDRSAIVFAIVTPLGLAVAFSSVIPDFTQDYHTVIGVVDEDGGELSTALADEVLGHLSEAGLADIQPIADAAAARTAVEAEEIGAAVAIPGGFTGSIHAGRATEVTIIGGPDITAREIARAAVTQFANQVGAAQLTATAIGQRGGTLDAPTMGAIVATVQGPAPVGAQGFGAAEAQADLSTFYGAAMAIMFVFFATQYGALAVLNEREAGTLNRLLAAPMRPASVIAGGAIAGMLLGLAAMTVMVVATTLLVGAEWGPPLLVAPLLVAAVVAAMGISALVATVARTGEQAGSLNAIVALCLAAIGGVFIPLSQAPELLGRIALVTPHAWFLRAVDELSLPSVSVVDIAPSLGVLVVIGVATGAFGLLRAHRALVAA